jgi:hypothetical protein
MLTVVLALAVVPYNVTLPETPLMLLLKSTISAVALEQILP